MTDLQNIFLGIISDNEWDVFDLNMLKSDGRLTGNEIREALRYLVKTPQIVQIEKGKYISRGFSDEKVIACFLVKDGGIAYWSALNLHGLTEQFPNKMYIQTSQWKKNKTVLSAECCFVNVKKNKVIGYDILGAGNHQYRVTNVEKTIVDCFDLPEYSGGYNELIRAFYKADTDQNKMIEYCTAINNIAVIKRIAFLSELFKKKKYSKFLSFANKMVNQKYNLLDGSGLDEGEFNNKWKLRLNISKEDIMEIVKSIY